MTGRKMTTAQVAAMLVGALGVIVTGAGIGWVARGQATTVSRSDTQVVWGHWSSFPRKSAPSYGGSEAEVYRSPDGKRVVGVFTHQGRYSYTFPFDEFAVVTAGSVAVTVKGGPSFTLHPGDLVYFPEGTSAAFVAGKDYANVAMFVGRKAVKW